MRHGKLLVERLMLCCLLGVAPVSAEEITLTIAGKERRYVRLPTEGAEVLRVRGPGELRLLTRARLAEPADGRTSWGLEVRTDGGQARRLAFEGVGPAPSAALPPGTDGTLTALRDHTLYLGRGHHSIEVAATGPQPVFLRYKFRPFSDEPQDWVAITPLHAGTPIELVMREALVPYYRNSPGQPFELDVIGPTEVRMLTRVENTPEMRGAIQYRLEVRLDRQVTHTFALTSRRSEVAGYLDVDDLVPGRATEVVIPVPAGRHRLAVTSLDPDKPTLLARFMLPVEALSLTMEPK